MRKASKAMRIASRAIGIITIPPAPAASEEPLSVKTSKISEPSDEPKMKKFAETIIITTPASNENGRRNNALINGTGVTPKLALLSNQAYIDANFLEPGSAMGESSSGMFHSNSPSHSGH